MRVAIIAALPREVAHLVEMLGLKWEKRKDGARGKIYLCKSDEVILVCAGMGLRRAAYAVEVALEAGPVDEIISVGLAGGLHEGLKAGAVLNPQLVIDAKTGERFEMKHGEGRLVTAQAVAGIAEKKRLRNSYGADIVDMEAATVGRIAEARGIAFRVMKSVSDEYDFEMKDLDKFATSDGWFREQAFILYIVVRPWKWTKVMQLAKNSNVAARNLCTELLKQMN